jgi:hypothetical protein
MNREITPSFNLKIFTCPHCGAIAHQIWLDIFVVDDYQTPSPVPKLDVSECQNPDCHKQSVWYNKKMVYPLSSAAPLPYDDMPLDVKEDFLEARDVVEISPRAAAALLRLALQKLMKHLGQKGEKINTDIGELVKAGLPVKIKLALDSLRIYGNYAVHPGEIDLKDDRETALKLFTLLNLIVYDRITQPKEIEELFNRLPESKTGGVKNRDNNGTQNGEIR